MLLLNQKQKMTEQIPSNNESWPPPDPAGLIEADISAHNGLTAYYGEKFKQAHQEARTDEETELANKRGFKESLSKLFAESSEEERKKIKIISFDLDNFKKVNDTRSHLVGDEVLKSVAVILQEIIPVREEKGEVIARIGGDEFIAAIIEDKTDEPDSFKDPKRNKEEGAKGAEGYIQRVRSGVKQISELIGMEDFGVSAGVASYQEPGFENETVEQFLMRVDSNLYADKAEKGNRR